MTDGPWLPYAHEASQDVIRARIEVRSLIRVDASEQVTSRIL